MRSAGAYHLLGCTLLKFSRHSRRRCVPQHASSGMSHARTSAQLSHVQLSSKRPVSPHVFEVDAPTQFHYKMPINAISSIANRVTGSVLTGGEFRCTHAGFSEQPML